MGIGGGLLLRLAEPTAEQIDLLGFAGELMLRLLKMLVLPLVAGSMIAGPFHDPAAKTYLSNLNIDKAMSHNTATAVGLFERPW